MNQAIPTGHNAEAVRTCDIVLAGFGGQGILLAGRLLASAAMREGLNVLVHNYYEGFVRGGISECTIVLSRDEIDSPVRDLPAVVATLDGRAHQTWVSKVRPGGLLLRNSSLVPTSSERGDIRIADIPATKIATDAGSQMAASMVVVGALATLTGRYGLDSCLAVLAKVVPANRGVLLDINARALRHGAAYAEDDGLALSDDVSLTQRMEAPDGSV